jgi:hypothetical protein
MPDKPTPKPADDTYSDEEATRRTDATIRAMIGMKPKPHSVKTKSNTSRSKRDKRQNV